MATPIEDCESLAWAMKKSVSSSAARSGDVDPDVSEGAVLEHRPSSRERSIFVIDFGEILVVWFDFMLCCLCD